MYPYIFRSVDGWLIVTYPFVSLTINQNISSNQAKVNRYLIYVFMLYSVCHSWKSKVFSQFRTILHLLVNENLFIFKLLVNNWIFTLTKIQETIFKLFKYAQFQIFFRWTGIFTYYIRILVAWLVQFMKLKRILVA